MRELRRALLMVAVVGLSLCSCTERGRGSDDARVSQGVAEAARDEGVSRVPRSATAVYEHVLRTGSAPRGHVGGRVFENREKRLRAGGNYREFDVHRRVKGRNRGPERVVVDLDSGKGWYTPDHYRTFIPIPRSSRGR